MSTYLQIQDEHSQRDLLDALFADIPIPTEVYDASQPLTIQEQTQAKTEKTTEDLPLSAFPGAEIMNALSKNVQTGTTVTLPGHWRGALFQAKGLSFGELCAQVEIAGGKLLDAPFQGDTTASGYFIFSNEKSRLQAISALQTLSEKVTCGLHEGGDISLVFANNTIRMFGPGVEEMTSLLRDDRVTAHMTFDPDTMEGELARYKHASATESEFTKQLERLPKLQRTGGVAHITAPESFIDTSGNHTQLCKQILEQLGPGSIYHITGNQIVIATTEEGTIGTLGASLHNLGNHNLKIVLDVGTFATAFDAGIRNPQIVKGKPFEKAAAVSSTMHERKTYLTSESLSELYDERSRATVTGVQIEQLGENQIFSVDRIGLNEAQITVHIEGEIVGRENELNQMRKQIRRVAEGKSSITLLTGEPGAGKSRLAYEMDATALKDFNLPVYEVSAFRKNSQRDYYFIEGFVRQIAQRFSANPAALYQNRSAQILAVYCGIDIGLQNARELREQVKDSLQSDPVLFARHILVCIEHNIISFDDLQWMDEKSTQVVRNIIKELKAHPEAHAVGLQLLARRGKEELPLALRTILEPEMRSNEEAALHLEEIHVKPLPIMEADPQGAMRPTAMLKDFIVSFFKELQDSSSARVSQKFLYALGEAMSKGSVQPGYANPLVLERALISLKKDGDIVAQGNDIVPNLEKTTEDALVQRVGNLTTIRNVMQNTFDRLEPRERQTLQRLLLFPAGVPQSIFAFLFPGEEQNLAALIKERIVTVDANDTLRWGHDLLREEAAHNLGPTLQDGWQAYQKLTQEFFPARVHANAERQLERNMLLRDLLEICFAQFKAAAHDDDCWKVVSDEFPLVLNKLRQPLFETTIAAAKGLNDTRIQGKEALRVLEYLEKEGIDSDRFGPDAAFAYHLEMMRAAATAGKFPVAQQQAEIALRLRKPSGVENTEESSWTQTADILLTQCRAAYKQHNIARLNEYIEKLTAHVDSASETPWADGTARKLYELQLKLYNGYYKTLEGSAQTDPELSQNSYSESERILDDLIRDLEEKEKKGNLAQPLVFILNEARKQLGTNLTYGIMHSRQTIDDDAVHLSQTTDSAAAPTEAYKLEKAQKTLQAIRDSHIKSRTPVIAEANQLAWAYHYLGHTLLLRGGHVSKAQQFFEEAIRIAGPWIAEYAKISRESADAILQVSLREGNLTQEKMEYVLRLYAQATNELCALGTDNDANAPMPNDDRFLALGCNRAKAIAIGIEHFPEMGTPQMIITGFRSLIAAANKSMPKLGMEAHAQYFISTYARLCRLASQHQVALPIALVTQIDALRDALGEIVGNRQAVDSFFAQKITAARTQGVGTAVLREIEYKQQGAQDFFNTGTYLVDMAEKATA